MSNGDLRSCCNGGGASGPDIVGRALLNGGAGTVDDVPEWNL